jgi:hypothetical protein
VRASSLSYPEKSLHPLLHFLSVVRVFWLVLPDIVLNATQGGGGGALWSSVLHLRGEVRCDQPVSDSRGNALCWNGEVYGGAHHVPLDQSDTRVVFDRLTAAISAKRAAQVKSLMR